VSLARGGVCHHVAQGEGPPARARRAGRGRRLDHAKPLDRARRPVLV